MTQEFQKEVEMLLEEQPQLRLLKEQWDQWLQDPVTQRMRSAAKSLREQAKNQWEQASSELMMSDAWPIANAVAIGQNKGWQWFQEMDFIGFATLTEDLERGE